MTASETTAREMLARYAGAIHALDPQAVLSLYDKDVVVFDAWNAWSYEGLDAWSAAVQRWLGRADAQQRFDAQDVRATGDADFIAVHAMARYSELAGDGSVRGAIDNRLGWVIRRTPAGWKIVHEHTSAPVDFETMKAFTKR
jgi:ketosteroid isomerase-like protein